MRSRWSDRLGALISTLLLTILAASAWLMSEVAQRSPLQESSGQASGPSARVFQAQVVRTNRAGEPVQQLLTPQLTQQADGSMDLETPTMRALRPDRPPVIVTSRKAQVSADQSRIDLDGDVRISRAAFADEPAILVLTPTLVVLPKEDIAKTDAPVVITRGASTLTGRGLVLDQKTDRLTILADSQMVLPRRDPTAP